MRLRPPFFSIPLVPLAMLAATLLATGCGKSGDAPAPAPAPAAAADAAGTAASATPSAAGGAAAPAAAASAPPVSVTTVRAQQRDLAVQLGATGSVVPLSSVEVRPQVSSVIAKVHIREGQFVKAGELLFTLDARADEANVAKARAQLARDEVAIADARRNLARSRELLAQNFVSQTAVDTQQATLDAQLAQQQSDRAALDAAQVPLSYARIAAPSAGRVGTIAVFAGSAVQANQTALVTITRLDPITVAFNLPQRHLPDLLAALGQGKPAGKNDGQAAGASVTATLPDGGGTLQGRLGFVDNAVDAATGTVKVKAEFDNPRKLLWPGAFVNVALTVRTIAGAVLVPQAAVIQSVRGPFVYTVKDGKAVPRPVQLLLGQGDEAAVSGVKPGEAVVLDGRQNLRPGSAVVERPREAARGASSAASGAAPGAASAAASASASAKASADPATAGTATAAGAAAAKSSAP